MQKNSMPDRLLILLTLKKFLKARDQISRCRNNIVYVNYRVVDVGNELSSKLEIVSVRCCALIVAYIW